MAGGAGSLRRPRAELRNGKLSNWKSSRNPRYLLALRATPAAAMPPPLRTKRLGGSVGQTGTTSYVIAPVVKSFTLTCRSGDSSFEASWLAADCCWSGCGCGCCQRLAAGPGFAGRGRLRSRQNR